MLAKAVRNVLSISTVHRYAVGCTFDKATLDGKVDNMNVDETLANQLINDGKIEDREIPTITCVAKHQPHPTKNKIKCLLSTLQFDNAECVKSK